MKSIEMKKNMYVLINDTYSTEKTHTATKIMKSMVNQIHKITYIRPSQYGDSAVIKGYYWHPEDLSKINPISLEKAKTCTFDTKELVL